MTRRVWLRVFAIAVSAMSAGVLFDIAIGYAMSVVLTDAAIALPLNVLVARWVLR